VRDVRQSQEDDEWEQLEGDAYAVAYRSGYRDDATTIRDHVEYARDVVHSAYPP
jgi:hypothetical protein